MSGFWKVCSFLCPQYLVGPLFAWITASMRRGMEIISLWHCWGVMEAQVALIAAFRSSALLGLCLSSSSWQYPIDSLWGSGPASLLANQAQFGKWNQHLHKACQQKEAWSALKFPSRWLRWLWTSENTLDQHQQMTWQPESSLTVETSHWTSSNIDSVPLHSSSRLWDLDLQIKCKMYFNLKRGLWTTEQQSSSFSP